MNSIGTLKGRVLHSHVIFEPVELNIVAFAWKAYIESLWIAKVPLEILHGTNVPWEIDLLWCLILKTKCFFFSSIRMLN